MGRQAGGSGAGGASCGRGHPKHRRQRAGNRGRPQYRDRIPSAFSDKLAASVTALQAAAGESLGQIAAIAAQNIAVLDRSANAQAETAARTIEIQRQAAADRLAVIVESEAKIAAATEKLVAARTAVLARQLAGDKDAELQVRPRRSRRFDSMR